MPIYSYKKENVFNGHIQETIFYLKGINYMLYPKKNEKELDRLESEKLDFHVKVYEGYKKLCSQYPDRIKVISADDTVENINRQVIEIIDGLLKGKYYE